MAKNNFSYNVVNSEKMPFKSKFSFDGDDIKKAISVGIGLFIALLGLEAAGVVIGDGATILALGDVRNNL